MEAIGSGIEASGKKDLQIEFTSLRKNMADRNLVDSRVWLLLNLNYP